MKRQSMFLAAALVAAVMLLTVGAGAFAHGWDIDEAEKVAAVSGKLTFSMPGGFTLTTTSGQKYKLMMHPMDFLDETGLELNADDRVSVSGYQVEDTVILVTELKKGSQTYTLMDPEDFEKYGPRYGGRGQGPGKGYGVPMYHHGPGPHMGGSGGYGGGHGGMYGRGSCWEDWN
jgi:hypothetical protein